jgi:hypothetical protein
MSYILAAYCIQTFRKRNGSKIQAMDKKFLRSIEGKSRSNTIRNKISREEV